MMKACREDKKQEAMVPVIPTQPSPPRAHPCPAPPRVELHLQQRPPTSLLAHDLKQEGGCDRYRRLLLALPAQVRQA
jgi:hypothetical protein